MENKDPQGTLLSRESESISKPPDPALHTPPPESNALSLEPTNQQPLISQEQQPSKVQRFLRFARRLDVLLAVLLVIAGAVVLFNVLDSRSNTQDNSSSMAAANRFDTVKIPLGELLSGRDLSLAGAANVTINGALQLNNSLMLTPSLQPTGAKPGQIYYDRGTNQLAYFNGQAFVFLNSPPQAGGVQSLGGATGQLTLGSGLSLTNGQLGNGGVLSVQGQTGDVTFTAGPGLVINGTNFSNSGVLTVASSSPNVSVTNDGSGNVTISMVSGAGTITSSGGTTGAIPVFTASQNIEDSIITQSGMTVTIAGDLSVVTGGLSLSNALTVSNGGTGATSFANNGVLVGQGTGTFAAVAAGGAGLCLLSTAGLPTWGACPGSAGVTTLNGLSGALNIANASGAGSTITIDNASTSAKGIASFSGTNFSVTSGAVNTIQNINTGATPTFAGLNTNSITPSAALTVGSTSQSLTLQGSATTTLTATNGANTTALSFVAPTANVTYRLQTASAGTYDVCTTAGNCSSAGAVTSPGGTVNRLAKFTGAQIIGDSIIVDNGSNVDIGGTLSVQGNSTLTGDIAVNGGDITASGALNITPGGTLTVGVTGQQLTLQGNASTTLTATNAGSTTSVTFQSPTANVTYRLPTASAGTYDLCSTVGNCAGSGGGVTTSGGTANRLAKFSGSQTINDSTITDNGTTVTTSVDLVIQGGDVTVGVANSQTGSITLAHSGSAFVGTILQGALTADRTYTLPDSDGTICLTSGNCSGAGSPNTLQAAYDAGNTITTTTARDIAITLADSATDANFTVTAATGSTGYVGIVRADGAGTADPAQLLLIDNLDTNRVQPIGIKIQAAGGGMTTGLDISDAEIVTAVNIGANDILGTTGNIDLSNFDVVGATGSITAGTLNGQTISSTASFTGTVAVAGNVTLTSDLAVNGGDITSSGALNITPGGTLTVGVTGQQLVLQGSANTQLTATGGGFTTTVGFTGTPTGALTYNFDRAAAAGTYTICTTIGNCAGSGGGVTTPGGTTGAIAKFTGAQTLGDSLLSESGSTVTVNGNLNLVSGNQFQVNGTQISSAALSNDSDLAKLSASQTFTGNTVAFKNGVDSTNSFNVQNAGGGRLLTADTSNDQIILGTGSSLDGKLVFSNVSNTNTVTILPGTPSANRTLTLPDASGIICTDSGNCAGAGATLQTAYNFSVGGTTPKIKVNSTLGGVDIQDADTTIAANLLNVRASNGSGLGSVLFGVGNTGAVTLQNSANSTTALRLLTAGGTAVLTGDTTNGQILLGQSSTLSGAIVFRNSTNTNTITLTTAAATGNRSISLPDENGTICLQSSTNCGFALSSGSGNYIQNQNSISQTADFRITGTGRADTALQAPAVDTPTAVALAIGQTNATGITLYQNTTVASGKTVTIQGNTTITPATDGTSVFNVRTSLGNNMFTVDTTNSRVGIGLGGSNVPTLQSSGLEIKGGIRLSGADSSYSDKYITPALGSLVDSLINVVNYAPANFGQIVAMGVPSSAASTVRVISLFDARTSAHQPTLSVFSPNEGQVGGFSWDGSNTDLAVKNTANGAIKLNINSTDRLVTNATGTGINKTPSATALDVTTASTTDVALKVTGITSQSGNLVEIAVTGVGTLASMTASGATTLQNGTNSQNAFRVLNAAGTTNVFNVDSSNSRAGVGTSSPRSDFDLGRAGATLTIGDTVTGGRVAFGASGISNSIDFSNNAISLYTSQTSGFQIFVDSDTDTGTPEVIVDDNGAATFRNRADGTTAFTVLNSASVPQFVVDTTNSRMYVGNPTADSTGALLVLDTKNTSGDPTGVNGGMYYNSSLGKMRCYEAGYWRDCSLSARTGFYYTNDLTTINQDAVMVRDASGTGADNDGSVVSGLQGHPGTVQQQTGSTSTGAAFLGSADANGTSILLGNGDTWRFETSVRIPTLSTGTQRFTYRAGFLDVGLADTDGGDGCFMKYNDNVNSGKWQGVCTNNGSSSTCDTGITVGANTWYRLTVFVNSAGNSTDFQTDGVSRCQVTTNIPTATGRETSFQNTLVKSIGGTERTADVDYIELQGYFSR